jgi:hypothetical protein
MSNKSWNEGVDRANRDFGRAADCIDRYTNSSVARSVSNAICDSVSSVSRNQGERAAGFERETGMSVRQQADRGIGPASHSFASE